MDTTYVERDAQEHFRKVARVYNAVAVVGARQSGKTTFLQQEARGMNSTYVLFDDPDARELFEEDVKKFEKQYCEGRQVTILDEAQYCKQSGQNIKYLVDSGRRLWITSSSETLLGAGILSWLVGRVSIVRLYPFSFSEFARARGQTQFTPTITKRLAWEHMTYGGYPRAVMAQETDMKRTILSDIRETMILKDVAQTFSIPDVQALERLSKYFAATIGGILSYETASRDLKISFQTLKKYLDALEKSNLIRMVSPYHSNKAKEITKQPKHYFVDTGIRNAITKTFENNPGGALFENYVFTELVKAGQDVKYWRTKSGAEVDFVLDNGKEVVPVEAKLTCDSDAVERSLRAFIGTYHPRKAIVAYYEGAQATRKIGECAVTFTDIRGLGETLKPFANG